jgi:two-component system heavy metal sensor histidine kinase CusS
MKRSFHLHVFLMSLLGVLIFLAASRFAVRYFADAFLLNYFNETLAHHAAREIDEAGSDLQVKLMARNLSKTIDDLQPGEMRISIDDVALEQADVPWKWLSKQSANHPFEHSYITLDAQVWSVLRTRVHGKQLFIQVQRQVLERSLEEILAVRNDIAFKIMPVLLAFTVLFSLFISYSSFLPINQLQKSFAKIHIHQRDQHISPTSNYLEFATFIIYFNALIDRLRNSYEQAARFSSDVSHELRTPLTIIRGHIDRLIQTTEDGSTLQINLVLIGEEVERLITISNKLLLLAQADAGKLVCNSAVINFSDILGQKVDDLAIYRKTIQVASDIQPHLQLCCDKELIEQLLSNLFNNAVKYNVPQGQITVTAKNIDHTLQLDIHNTTHLSMGAGLDDRVFDRFYRHRETSAQAGSDATGSGLGLSLCREIVKAHGGTIHLRKGNDQWVGFEVSIPLG